MSSPLERFAALFSPPRPVPAPKNEDHNKNSTQTGISSRCQFTFSDGRQCRNQSASLCLHHASKHKPSPGAEGAPDVALEGLCGDLTTATNINRALTQVFLLMAQGRIPQKQAVAFGYLTQLLLQTVPGIRSEFVSAHGYRAWEQKLKSSLEANQSPEPSPAPSSPPVGENQQPVNEVVEPEKAVSSRESLLAANVYHPPRKGYPQDALFAVNKVELRGAEKSDQELSHVNSSCEIHGDQELSHVDKVTPSLPQEQVFAGIYRRSLDLLDRKYNTTPEGRREAKAVMCEIEATDRMRFRNERQPGASQNSRDSQKQKSAAPPNASRPSPPPAPPAPAPASASSLPPVAAPKPAGHFVAPVYPE